MPNWCENMLTLSHENPEMITRARDAFARGEFLNEFVPTPGGEWDYDWCVKNWGTKWDVGDGSGINIVADHELVVYFDSAWSPPIAAYERLQDLGFAVHATYYEPGMAFCGIYDECGDECYNLSGMDSGDVQQQIPQDLDEQFGISESMAESERANQDEVTTWYKDGVESTGLDPHVIKKEKI
jgi:hypothetical protein